MFSYFKKSKKQKELYFQLDYEFKKTEYEEKLSGIYAIFKDDICLYVGQSKNMSSRIATHLSGKYKDSSRILIFPTIDNQDDLVALEKYTMQLFQPIENILIDFSESINKEDFAEGSIVYELDRCDCFNEEFNILRASEFTIINNSIDIFISNDIHVDLYHNTAVTNNLAGHIVDATNFHMRDKK